MKLTTLKYGRNPTALPKRHGDASTGRRPASPSIQNIRQAAMSTTIWPPIAPDELKKAESDTLARELAWLLDHLQETLAGFKEALEECKALLAPTEPGSILAMSSVRSEIVKGHINRVGTMIVKGSLVLRLRHYSPTQLAVNATHPLILPTLSSLRELLNQSLDCIDITCWTGDRTSAPYISSQLRLLHSLLGEAHSSLKGSAAAQVDRQSWLRPVDPNHFQPPLPDNLSLDFSIQEASIVLTIRVLESADAAPDIKSRFATVFLTKRAEHDEEDLRFNYNGSDVKVKEKVKIDSADPNLMAAMAKLAALEHAVGMARCCLAVVMEEDVEEVERLTA
ncbi:hypothetical protein VC83_08420 [Pseudogymnoascus destructans]|nr:uncharacterized protein VC83_08420 [Pseudogymnoascus destructans]OAF55150.2 hypothetical protein VC83_08420 [Pseudogymnoascus destructans]